MLQKRLAQMSRCRYFFLVALLLLPTILSCDQQAEQLTSAPPPTTAASTLAATPAATQSPPTARPQPTESVVKPAETQKPVPTQTPVVRTPSPTPTETPVQKPSPEPTKPPTPTAIPTPSTADVPTHSSAYIKFDGIDGEAQDKDHKGWSEIVSFTHLIQKARATTGITGRRDEVVFGDLVVVKQVDKASPKLEEAICRGKVFPKVEIHLTGPSVGSKCQGTFYAYTLKNVVITSYKVSGSNPLAYALIAPAPAVTMPPSGPYIAQAVDAPMEELSLQFEELRTTYTECDSTGGKKGNIEYTWKVEGAAPPDQLAPRTPFLTP